MQKSTYPICPNKYKLFLENNLIENIFLFCNWVPVATTTTTKKKAGGILEISNYKLQPPFHFLSYWP